MNKRWWVLKIILAWEKSRHFFFSSETFSLVPMQKTCLYFCYAVTMRSFPNRESRYQSSSGLHTQFLLIINCPLSIPQVMVEYIKCFFYSVLISESERDEISTINFEAAQIHFLSKLFETFPLSLLLKLPVNGFYVQDPDR